MWKIRLRPAQSESGGLGEGVRGDYMSYVSNIEPKEYENAIYLRIDSDLGQYFRVEKNYHYKGKEIDIAVIDDSGNILIGIECRRRKRGTNKKEVRELIKKLKDMGVITGYIISVKFSNDAEIHVKEKGFEAYTITVDEACKYNWFDKITHILPYVQDECSSHFVTRALISLIHISDPEKFIDWIDSLTLESWLETISLSMQINLHKTIEALQIIAEKHYDSGWRFQAIEQLNNHGYLDSDYIEYLLLTESDLEVRDFLQSLMANFQSPE